MKLLIITFAYCMFVMQHSDKASHAYKNNLNTGVVSFGKKYVVRHISECCNFHPSFYLLPKMQHSGNTNNATKQSNSTVTLNPRKGYSKKFPTIKFKRELDYDVQKDCDGLVLDVFYDWVGFAQKETNAADIRLLNRLKKVRTRFIETI